MEQEKISELSRLKEKLSVTFWILVLKHWMEIGKSKRNPDKHKNMRAQESPPRNGIAQGTICSPWKPSRSAN